MSESKPARALILNGGSGVGKSSALQEIGALLRESDMPHALVDLDFLTLSWPRPQDDPWGARIARENLASLTANYRRTGIDRLVVAHVFTDRTHLDGCREALGASSARHATEAEWELDGFLAGLDELARTLDAADLDDHVIDVDALSPREVAERVIAAAGW